MKKIISGTLLQKKMQESINLLCKTVKTTLGPIGKNSIIDHSALSPFITNDGATIARNIESDDEAINTILEIAKEASLQTNDKVGDGTTTTLVLLEYIFNESMKYIKKGKNPILLKKDLEECLKFVLKQLENKKRKITDTYQKKIASIATNDREMGTLITKVFQKVKSKNAISIEEIEENKINVTYYTGYSFNIELSPIFKNKKIIIDNAYLLITNDVLQDIESISNIINLCINEKKSLIIIANEYLDNFENDMISLNLNDNLEVYLLKINEYGLNQELVKQDLEIITNAKCIQDTKRIPIEALGIIKKITIDHDLACIQFNQTNYIKKYLKNLQLELNSNNEFETDFLKKRTSMLQNGLAKIEIGARTKTERREKKMRLEDGICALESAKKGILIGCGITLLEIANEIKIKKEADEILKNALMAPFKQIIENAGLNEETIYKNIKEKKYQVSYNILTDSYEDIENASVIDSYLVIKTALINAISIATLLITTESLIINEYKNENNLNVSF